MTYPTLQDMKRAATHFFTNPPKHTRESYVAYCGYLIVTQVVEVDPYHTDETKTVIKIWTFNAAGPSVFTPIHDHGATTVDEAKAYIDNLLNPLTELQEEVLSLLRSRNIFGIADGVEKSWRRGKMAYVDGRTPIPGIRRKFDRANKEILTRIGERVIKGEQA